MARVRRDRLWTSRCQSFAVAFGWSEATGTGSPRLVVDARAVAAEGAIAEIATSPAARTSVQEKTRPPATGNNDYPNDVKKCSRTVALKHSGYPGSRSPRPVQR